MVADIFEDLEPPSKNFLATPLVFKKNLKREKQYSKTF